MKTFKHFFAVMMVCCLGATSAYAQPANDNCGGAIGLTPGTVVAPGFVTGTTNGATTVAGDTNTCWASGMSHTVWYSFTAAAGSYTITTDVSDGSSPDTQLELFSGACGSLTPVACNEDGGSCASLAAEITTTLTAGTYYIMVDIYDTDTGSFKIAVIDNNATSASSNDCFSTPISITAGITSISASSPFNCTAYDYFNVTKDSIRVGGGLYGDCNTPAAAANANTTYYGVWFEFVVGAGGIEPTWISVQGLDLDKCDNGESAGLFYTMHLFKYNDASHTCGTVIPVPTGQGKGCSIGDGLGTNDVLSGRDKACGSFFDHPRLDISGLAPGTYSLMVAQMTRVNTVPGTCYQTIFNPITGQPEVVEYPCDVEEIAEPSNGVFNLLIEAAPVGDSTSIDGISHDNCVTAVDVTSSGTLSGLTNAGLIGNLWAGNSGTCKPSATANEPLAYSYAASGHGYNNESCDSTALTIPVGATGDNNNSAVYSFTVADPSVDGQTLCFYKDSLKEDILTDLGLLCDTILEINLGAFPTIFDPTNGNVIIDLGDFLTALDLSPIKPAGDSTIAIPHDITCDLLGTLLNGILTTVFDSIPTDTVCIPVNCSPTVNIAFCNLDMCGNADNGAAVWVTKDDCVNGAEVMFAPIDGGTNALTLNTALEPLSPGTYYIVVDGHGATLKYDLTVDVTYSIGLGGAPCSQAPPSQNRTASGIAKNGQSLSNIQLQPVPASNQLTVKFNTIGATNNVSIAVVDMTGKQVIATQKVEAAKGTNEYTLDVSALSSGMYLLRFDNNGERVVTKFSVAK